MPQPPIRYSQNFLHNQRLVTRLINAAALSPDDVVLEIGPGKGIITHALAARCGHVIAVEKDSRLTDVLQQRFARNGKVTIFAADFLDFPLPATSFKVFSSIPYAITTAIVSKLTTGVAPPQDSYLIMQAEAAAKLTGCPRQTLSSLKLFPVFRATVEHRFSRSDFRPVAAVDSVLLHLHRRPMPLLATQELSRYMDFVTTMFIAWKPTLREALRTALPTSAIERLQKTTDDDVMNAKPGDVAPEVWIDLFGQLCALDDRRIWRAIDGATDRLTMQQSRLQKSHRSRVSGRR